jgi:hypothetical protein
MRAAEPAEPGGGHHVHGHHFRWLTKDVAAGFTIEASFGRHLQRLPTASSCGSGGEAAALDPRKTFGGLPSRIQLPGERVGLKLGHNPLRNDPRRGASPADSC